ncbi:transglycosylase family protein [Nocardioides mesophilus]|uniref:Transglycosylase family protein n=1 Tax=Nocardioides mesophilus TaxID=433659 RepID=A0A7G9RED9_9ACTN|nr:transglycosylase family protein [Nocardioides mesophilus]QNN53964.1 transglycosylase family protein [Nocardioides mesophilus]
MPVRLALRHTLLLVVALMASLTATTLPASAHSGATSWDCIAHYESTHRWHINTGNGHYGGLQFSLSTWRYYGGPKLSGNAYPHRATRAEQIAVAKRVAYTGWSGRAPQGGSHAWPNTWPRCH